LPDLTPIDFALFTRASVRMASLAHRRIGAPAAAGPDAAEEQRRRAARHVRAPK
jgi:hypothetical protein